MHIWRSRRWGWLAQACVTILFVLVFWHPFPPDVHTRGVGIDRHRRGPRRQPAARFPDGKLMLVDGGGTLSFGRRTKPRMDIGEDVVSPYLWRRSIRKSRCRSDDTRPRRPRPGAAGC